ncbi:MAG: NAD(P)/FAD-dependent oxidoreductase [Polyangiaceae bacterium]
MARTPLVRLFTRAVRLARIARRTGAPLSEVAAAEREHRLNRRALLGAAAGFAALPLLPGCDDDGPNVPIIEPDATLPTVAIIGGGIAGLHCAYLLAQLGIVATVYEASKRLGGRMFSDRATFPGQTCEMGGEFMDSSHETMQLLAEELGIARRDFATDDPSLSYIAHFGGKLLSEDEIVEGYAPIAAKIEAALGTLEDQDDPFVYFDKPNGGDALDKLSITEWFEKEKIDGTVRKLLEVAYTREFGVEPDELNCLSMMFLLATDLSTEEFKVFGSSDERYTVDGGNDLFIQRLAQALDPGQIELGVAMEAITETEDGRYLLSLLRDGSPEEISVDHVVLALPFSKLRELEVNLDLPAAQKKAIQEIGYGLNTKLMCGFTKRIWRDVGGNGEMFTDRPFQAGWDSSRMQSGDQGIYTNYLGGDLAASVAAGAPFERMLEFLDDVDGVVPGMKDASNGLVQRAPWDISYSCYLVGQYTTITGSESIPYNGVHFAGEHTNLDYQGWMEGAAISGARVAAEIAEAAGLAEATMASTGNKPPADWTARERMWYRANLYKRYRRLRRVRGIPRLDLLAKR